MWTRMVIATFRRGSTRTIQADTSERLTDEKVRGKVSRVWKLRSSERDNRFFDCCVYNMALAEHLGLSQLTDAEWRAIARARGVPARIRAVPDAPQPGPAPVAPQARPAFDGIGSDADFRKRLEELASRNASLIGQMNG
jgi:hypothetical protein